MEVAIYMTYLSFWWAIGANVSGHQNTVFRATLSWLGLLFRSHLKMWNAHFVSTTTPAIASGLSWGELCAQMNWGYLEWTRWSLFILCSPPAGGKKTVTENSLNLKLIKTVIIDFFLFWPLGGANTTFTYNFKVNKVADIYYFAHSAGNISIHSFWCLLATRWIQVHYSLSLKLHVGFPLTSKK